MTTATPVIGIIISGRGSNMQAIIESVETGNINATVGVVISNRASAPGLSIAQRHGVPTFVATLDGRSHEERERDIVSKLKEYGVALVCLAGYMRICSPWFVAQFPSAILNIHPSLLPAFPGEDAHTDVLAHGAKVSGCTVHILDEQVDHGPIVVQRTVPVYDGDTKTTLADRVLKQEHFAYTEAINMVLSGNYEVVGRRFQMKGI